MLRDLLLWAFATFVVEPHRVEVTRQLAAVRAPTAVVEAVAGCAGAAVPALADRALTQPWWALTTVSGVWICLTSPDAVLRDAVPVCRPAIEAARPYLTGRAASG